VETGESVTNNIHCLHKQCGITGADAYEPIGSVSVFRNKGYIFWNACRAIRENLKPNMITSLMQEVENAVARSDLRVPIKSGVGIASDQAINYSRGPTW